MKKPLAVGERIRVYGFDPDDARKSFDRTVEATIDDDGLLRTDAGEYVHPKQCRRLKPKARRTVWVTVDGDGSPGATWPARAACQDHVDTMNRDFPNSGPYWAVEFIEARTGKGRK